MDGDYSTTPQPMLASSSAPASGSASASAIGAQNPSSASNGGPQQHGGPHPSNGGGPVITSSTFTFDPTPSSNGFSNLSSFPIYHPGVVHPDTSGPLGSSQPYTSGQSSNSSLHNPFQMGLPTSSTRTRRDSGPDGSSGYNNEHGRQDGRDSMRYYRAPPQGLNGNGVGGPPFMHHYGDSHNLHVASQPGQPGHLGLSAIPMTAPIHSNDWRHHPSAPLQSSWSGSNNGGIIHSAIPTRRSTLSGTGMSPTAYESDGDDPYSDTPAVSRRKSEGQAMEGLRPMKKGRVGRPPKQAQSKQKTTTTTTTPTTTIGHKQSGSKKARVSSSSAATSPVKKEDEVKVEDEDEDGEQEDEEDHEDELRAVGDAPEEEEKMDHRKRKRNRTIRSCVPCHNHKRKCDRRRPCGRCTALGLTGTCVYEVDDIRAMSDPTVAESERLRRRIAELEKVVRELRQRQPSRAATAAAAAAAASTSASAAANSSGPPTVAVSTPNGTTDSNQPNGSGAGDTKKRRVIVDRYARLKMGEVVSLAHEAGAVTDGEGPEGDATPNGHARRGSKDDGEPGQDRHGSVGAGGEKKDYWAEPYTTYFLPGEEMVEDRIGRRTFLGASAGKSMLRRLREITRDGTVGEDSDLLSIPEETAFTGVFPDLRKTFPFTTIWSHENFSGEIIGLLPDKEQSEILLATWEEEVSSYFLAWHVPSLKGEFRRFFAMTTAEKMNVPLSSLSLFLMICSLGCVMRATRSEIFGHPDSNGREDEPSPKTKDPKDITSSRLQSELYLSGAYQALRLCSFLSNPSVASIQAQILVNIYLFNSERAADAWAQTGSLVRQCIAMGLHVDPARLDAKISLRDAEVRRRIWWTVAGLDALLCVSFGRPSVINFYQTSLPQDRTDDNLSDSPGTGQRLLPPSNVLSNETTDMTYHAAYFQLTIPSYELLDRIFHVDRTFSRSAIYGWFSPSPDGQEGVDNGKESGHTYEGAMRLANDINQWYAHIPRDMRFEPEEDTAETLKALSPRRVNQRLILCSKTFMIVMVLHRPYLRADPAAYPESSEICYRAAHLVLSAYRVGAGAGASSLWVWWTVSYRAFHAGAVCAFLAIRQPGTELARRCMDDLRGAIAVIEGRMTAWKNAHPVQADLRDGLIKLEQLATAATRQKSSPTSSKLSNDTPLTFNPNLLSAGWQSQPHDASYPMANIDSHHLFHPGAPTMGALHPSTPLSEIRGFPDLPVTSPGVGVNGVPSPNPGYPMISGDTTLKQVIPSLGGGAVSASYSGSEYPFQSDSLATNEAVSLPHFWASMFGIRMDKENGEIHENGGVSGSSGPPGGGGGGGGRGQDDGSMIPVPNHM
ncbi:fungal-specific transcription factor domain-domain-containing protein [Kockovaella imperatae]|uniref:Fungal-specific transcription factor domain-domain-containing protein n=1 Tax=Kockovaella imperatae TaxID=4999 RepID=A0A1Y1UCQ8_9TREE|nr:fungal-specific transcription factor domain-domain-containing protein [Kockovaella imperatae]ORX35799.1 fungal-specific transcription factor domain-domain-containing protein [Kockovaella imperatae]